MKMMTIMKKMMMMAMKWSGKTIGTLFQNMIIRICAA